MSRAALSQTNPLGVNRAQPLSPVSQMQVDALQRVFEHLSEGLVLSTITGEIVHWNRAAIGMHGLIGSNGELQPVTELLDSYQLETLDGRVLPLDEWPLMRTIRGELVQNMALRMRRLDRPFDRIFSYGGSLVNDERGVPQLAVVHITDITSRVEAEQSLARELGRHALLLQCSQRLLDPDTISSPPVEELFALVSGHLKADIMFHFRLESLEQPMRLAASAGLDEAQRRQFSSYPIGQPFCGVVAQLRQPVIVDENDIEQSVLRDAAHQLGLRAYACHPLIGSAGEVLGTLAFGSTKIERFAEEDIRFLHTLSHMVASFISRNESAATLRKRDAFINALLDQLPIVLWSTDRDLRFTDMRGGALLHTSYGPERLLGRRVEDILVNDREAMLARYRDALKGDKTYYDVEREGRLLRSHVGPLLDASGQIQGVVGMSLDITEQARNERALREAAENMVEAQRIAHFGSWELPFDADGKPADRMFWSDELYSIYGLEPERDGMTRLRARSFADPEDAARADAMTRRLDESCPEWHEKSSIVRPDGTVRHIHVHARLYNDESTGRPRKMVGTIQDITDQHRSEEEVRRLNADLERRVLERTSELEAANAELESFAYAVAHDLRAPLRAMAGFGRALIEDYGTTFDPEAREYLDEIIGASRQMGELIDALLNLSRHTRGELRREVVDLSEMADRVLRGLAKADPARQVDWSVAPGLLVRGDHRMLDVVFQNLLSNAWKYSAKVARAEIRVEGEQEGSELRVRVRDNGAGFSMDHAAKLFQPFQRLHRQDEFAGIGIGLATVLRIVRRHGGAVTARGTPGQGAEFRLSLPAAEAAA